MALKEQLNKLAKKELTEGEFNLAVDRLSDYLQTLIEINKGINDESSNISKSIKQGTRGRTFTGRPKFTPYRICD